MRVRAETKQAGLVSLPSPMHVREEQGRVRKRKRGRVCKPDWAADGMSAGGTQESGSEGKGREIGGREKE